MDTDKTAQAKIDKPNEFFADPLEVVIDPGLSKDQKIDVLNGLEQDARQLAEAANEGMGGGAPNQLHDILGAKDALELSPKEVAYALVHKDLHDQRKTAEGGATRVAAENALVALHTVAKAGEATVALATHGAVPDGAAAAGSAAEAEIEHAMERLDP